MAVPDKPLTRLEQYWDGILEKIEGGGGNPNYVETITGTVANPWGDIDFDELVTMIRSGDADAILEATISILIEGEELTYGFKGYMSIVNDDLVEFSTVLPLPNFIAMSLVYTTANKDFSYAHGGVYDELNTELPEGVMNTSVSSNLTVIHHPLPNGG